ncbi:MAG TPA: aldose 1-epimerase [Cytophagaceae bacterium]|nr:aldose 1-epimerase [Cytophagaceae bacterium]
MVSIRPEEFQGIERLKLLNEESGEFVSIVPAYGGNINELVLRKNSRLHSLIAGDQLLDTLSGTSSNFYRGAKLSPYPNRVEEGSYVFKGQRYQLPKNDTIHALHGLLWNIPFSVRTQEASEEAITLTLTHEYRKNDPGFPFHYDIRISYTLDKHHFSCRTTLINTSSHAVPIGDGWHPYFKLESGIDELKLQLPSNRRMEMNDSLIPTGSYLYDATFELPVLIGDKMLDHCFELDHGVQMAETKLINEKENLVLVLWQRVGENGYRFIQVYTPPDRQSVAIEPMSCAPNAFNNEKGLLVLEPQESVTFEFGIKLE